MPSYKNKGTTDNDLDNQEDIEPREKVVQFAEPVAVELGEATDVQDNSKVVNPKTYHALRKLNTWYNPTLENVTRKDDSALFGLDSIHDGLSMENDVVFMGAVNSDPTEPKTFNNAWNHPDTKEREGWRQAIKFEYQNMMKQKVWETVPQSSIPENRRLIGSKWVFKRKRDGVY